MNQDNNMYYKDNPLKMTFLGCFHDLGRKIILTTLSLLMCLLILFRSTKKCIQTALFFFMQYILF